MEVGLAVLADFASTTAEGKLNIMGIFGEINAPTLPFVLPTVVYLVVQFDVSLAETGSEKSLQVRLMDDEGRPIIDMHQPVTVPQAARPGGRVQINNVIGLGGLRFDRAGDYQFAVLVNGEEKKAIPLRVNAAQPGGSAE
jgi:hypothetical protein